MRSIAILLLAVMVSGGEELKLLQVIPLAGETAHVQGIDLDAARLWVTSVDTKAKRGLLSEYTLPEGRLIRSVEIQDGIRFHPGGMMADGDSLWIPVAEYRRESTAVIQRRSRKTLQLEAQFAVNDHIGAIAATPKALVGANWDAKDLYVWDRSGKQISKTPNPTGVAFQDLKFEDGELVGGGLLNDKSGVIVWMAWPSLREERRMPVGRTDRGIAYTHEGMAIRKDRIWFLPEDTASRLFVFERRPWE